MVAEFAIPSIPADTDTERYCPECNQMKLFEQFYRDGKTPDGVVRYRRDCKDCYKEKRVANKRAKRKAEAARAAAEIAARKKARKRK